MSGIEPCEDCKLGSVIAGYPHTKEWLVCRSCGRLSYAKGLEWQGVLSVQELLTQPWAERMTAEAVPIMASACIETAIQMERILLQDPFFRDEFAAWVDGHYEESGPIWLAQFNPLTQEHFWYLSRLLDVPLRGAV